MLFFKFCLILSALTSNVRANVGDSFGFGSRSAALGGTATAGGDRAYAAYSNPAALASDADPHHPGSKLVASLGLLYMHPSFTPIDQVVTQNPTYSDQNTTTTGTVDTDYPDTLGQEIGLALSPLKNAWNLSVGIAIFTPAQNLASLDSGETTIPEYVLYRSRTQRTQYHFGLGVQPVPKWSIGVGISAGYSITSQANAFLATSSSRISTLRVKATAKPKTSPYFSLLYGDTEFSTGLTVRLPLRSTSDVALDSSFEALSGFAAPSFSFTSQSAMIYDPLSVEWGVQFQTLPGDSDAARWRTSLQVDYERWRDFEIPAYSLQADPTKGIVISAGTPPSHAFQDLWIPRIGQEIPITPAATLRLGYAYYPGIIETLPRDSSNYLDPPKHALNAGWGWHFAELFGLMAEGSFDLHASLQILDEQSITKDSTSSIGAPGYLAGGKVWGGGFSLSLGI